jgi:hypothetical protein
MSANDELEATIDAPEQDLPLEWIMASIAAWLLAFAIRNLLGAFLEAPQGASQIVQILYNIPAPLLVGLALGALQFYVLRTMLVGAWRWIVFSGIAYPVGAIATGVAAQALLLGLIQNGTITSQQQVDTLQIVLQIVVGLLLGLLQWVVFRSSHRRSALWIPTVGVGFMLATVTLIVLGTYVAAPIARAGGFFGTGQGGLILEVILRLLSGAVFGGATLFGLQRILRTEPRMMEYDE